MSISHRYREFGKNPKKSKPSTPADASEIEEEKLKSFEAGYQAGWDDAMKAQTDDRNRISAEFAQNLQDISFSYHEASTKLSAAIEPIFSQMVEKVLPEISRKTLGVHIVEQVMDVVSKTAAGPIEIVAAPGDIQSLETLLDECLPDPFTLVADETLENGQVYVRVGTEERRIDLSAIIEGVSKAANAFFHELKEKKSDG